VALPDGKKLKEKEEDHHPVEGVAHAEGKMGRGGGKEGRYRLTLVLGRRNNPSLSMVLSEKK